MEELKEYGLDGSLEMPYDGKNQRILKFWIKSCLNVRIFHTKDKVTRLN